MPEIPNGVEKMGNMFENCTSLVETTTIPNSVNMMSYTFQNCTSLETAPVIPESVDYLYATFNGCSNLTGTIEINSTPFSYPNALKGTQITEITGACSDARKEQILATR